MTGFPLTNGEGVALLVVFIVLIALLGYVWYDLYRNRP